MGNFCSSTQKPDTSNRLKILDSDRYRKKEDLTYKIVILGDVFVGKTSILSALKHDNRQKGSYDPTIGFAFSQKTIPISNGVRLPENG